MKTPSPRAAPDVRCFVEEDLTPGTLFLSSEEAHHLLSVRRKHTGDSVLVLNGRGEIAQARIQETGNRSAALDVRTVETAKPPKTQITLCLAHLKPAALDLVIEKSVELGLGRLWLVQTEHAVAQLDAKKLQKKQKRWRSKMIEAAKQSANPWLPEIEVLGSCAEAVERLGTPVRSFSAMLGHGPRPVHAVLQGVQPPPPSVVLWVGPEGDFSTSECAVLERAGVEAVSLGPTILRAETAALSFLSIAQAVWNW